MRVSSPTTETRWIETSASLSAREREENLASYVHRLGTDIPDDVVPSFSSLVPSQTNVMTRSRPARFLARSTPSVHSCQSDGWDQEGRCTIVGLPADGDEGELEIGIYTTNRGVCIGRAIMEVVSKTWGTL